MTNKISESITSKIKIQAISEFVPQNTNNDDSKNVFVYWIIITNYNESSIKLISRYWEIIDAYGKIKIVEGKGVVGKQPVIDSNKSFKYNSFCVLDTKFGSMKGYYKIKIGNGKAEKIKIPQFKLLSTFSIN